MAPKAAQTGLVIRHPNRKEEITIEYATLRRAALMLRAVNHPLRKQIIRMMDEKKDMTVTEIYTKLKLEQSVASQHLAVLRKAGITTTSRQGKYIYYSINHKRIEEILNLADDLAKA